MSDAEIDAHIGAIRTAMTPEESETVRVWLEELVFAHRRIWIEKLCQMSVPEGVAFLRTQLAEAQRDASARDVVGPRVVRVARAAPSSAAPPATPVPPTAPRPSAPGRLRRDGRRAAGSPVPSTPPHAASTAGSGGAPTGGLSMVSPIAQAHLDAIQSALTAEEDTAVRSYLTALSAAERSAWITMLLSLPVPEAVAMIRTQRSADRASAVPKDDPTPAATAVTAETARNAAPRISVVPALTLTPPPVSTTSATPNDAGPSALAPRDTPESSAPTVLVAPLSAAETPAAATSPDAAPGTPPDAAPTTAPRPVPVETNADAHLLAIELALTDAERLRVHAMVAQMSPDDRETLLDELLSAPVPQGAALLRRATIQGQTTPTIPTPATGDHAPDGYPSFDHADTLNDAEILDEELAEDGERGPREDDDQSDDERASDEGQPAEAPARADGTEDHHRTAIAPTAPPSAGLPTLPPEAFLHFKAIDTALTLAERMRVFELAARLSPTELRTWIRELTVLPLADAVAKVRAALAAAEFAPHPAKKDDAP
jgi:hypothetical protein